jgi:hypothetical protein
MATINTILTITDNISGQLGTIQMAVDNIKGSFDGLDGSTKTSEETMNKFSFATFVKNAEEAGTKIAGIGTKMTLALTAPLLLLGKKMYGTAVDYESAWADVRKTTKATDQEFAELYDTLLGISETKPVDFIGLTEIGFSASQMGVPYQELENFIGTAADLEAATDIVGEEGVKSMARFFNVTEKGTANIGRFGGAIVELGNNFAATENEILNMATNVAPTAALNKWNVPQILAISAAMVSMGIRAEAGGTSAAKFMDKMSLASEVGLDTMNRIQAMKDKVVFETDKKGNIIGEFKPYEFESILDVQKFMEVSDNVAMLADDLNVTKEQAKRLVDSWVDLDYFAKISGKTADKFKTDWQENPAQGMLDFFTGLSALDESGAQSAIAVLDEMGITEIRMARMIKGLTGNTALYSDALKMAAEAYAENPLDNALTREAAQRYETQESQNKMLGNKLQNSMANLGDNLVQAVQPALDAVNGLLDAFNKLSEADQQKVINTFLIFAAGGPIVLAIGKTVETIGKIGKGINWIIQNRASWASKLTAMFGSSTFWGIAAGVGILLLISYLDSIPTKVESIVTSMANIPITVDDESVNATLEAIQKVQEAADKLKGGGEASIEAQNTSAAVKMGYGTSTMYGTALGYEALMANTEIDNITTDYVGRIRAAEQTIINAQTDAERAAGLATVQQLENDMKAAVQGARDRYAQTVSNLFNGMAGQYPEMAEKLVQAQKQYDLMAALTQRENFLDYQYTDAYQNMAQAEQQKLDAQKAAEAKTLNESIIRYAAELGYLGNTTAEQALKQWETGTPFNTITYGLMEKATEGLTQSAQALSQNPVVAGFLQSILSDPSITENLDFSGLDGALNGIVGMLDFKQAAQQAVDSGKPAEFGQYLVMGLGQGVTDNANLIAPSFTSVRDAALTALQAAFQMHSPSQLMAAQGIFIPQGLAQGILAGQSAVISAAIQVAQAGIRAAKAELGIASPSKIFEQLGIFTGQGFAFGIASTAEMVGRAVETMTHSASESVWDLIDVFNDLEYQDMLSDDKDLKVSETDLRRMRDLAERQAINRFTTAELKVEFTANNTIKSDLDLDGIVTHLETLVEDTLMSAAEGVYS